MTEERKQEIEQEAKRRAKLWLSNTSFNKMTVNGSLIRFDMALGLFGGYPFQKEDWMEKGDFEGFVTQDEFDSVEYDAIILRLFRGFL